jgi:molybdate transport system ATP-binding protein
MINIINFEHPQLHINHWQVDQCESWCILGRNGSGKQYLDQLLTGELTAASVELCQLPQAE